MIKKLNISFDFDGTLHDDFDGIINTQKEEIRKIARKYIAEGHDVCILTKRYDMSNPSLGKGHEYKEVLYVAKLLGINKVFFTNRNFKNQYIIDLKIDMHFENAEYEVKLIEESCLKVNHKCVVVPVEDPYWRDLVY